MCGEAISDAPVGIVTFFQLSESKIRIQGASQVKLTGNSLIPTSQFKWPGVWGVSPTWIFPSTPVVSILLATFTLLPQMSYWGFWAPMTPAITGPWLIPARQETAAHVSDNVTTHHANLKGESKIGQITHRLAVGSRWMSVCWWAQAFQPRRRRTPPWCRCVCTDGRVPSGAQTTATRGQLFYLTGKYKHANIPMYSWRCNLACVLFMEMIILVRHY